MPRIIRTLALSGVAAVAVLGTAATASADTPEEASAVVQAAVDRAVGVPVSLPDGRVLHVRGLDSVTYRADADHRTTVVTLAAGPGTDTGTVGIESTLNQPRQQGGFGSNVGVTPQQVTTQAGAGTLSATAVAALVMGVVLYFGIKHGKVSRGWAIGCVVLGVLLSPTFVGPLVGQLTGSGATTFGNLWAGL